MHLRALFNVAAISYTLLHAPVASASYFSSGWSPNAATTKAAEVPAPAQSASLGAPVPTTSSSPASSGFDWTVLITQGPIGDLFRLAGVNVTERLEQAKKAATEVPYDTRIPLITDENYDGLVKEGGDPNKDDTWFMVVTMGTSKDPISKFVDDAFDKAYNISLEKKDLPHIKWGRVDYMAVTRITSEWLVWKAPVLVVAREHGKELRFISPSQISLEPANLHKFLKLKGWSEIPVWDGPFAPGGDLEKYVKIYANWSTMIYSVVSKIPKWLFLIVSGSVASVLIQFMHGKEKDTPAKEKVKKVAAGTSDASPPTVEKRELRPKRFVVKRASEVHPELASDMSASMMSGSMTASAMSESDNPDGTKRPSSGPRRSTRKVKK